MKSSFQLTPLRQLPLYILLTSIMVNAAYRSNYNFFDRVWEQSDYLIRQYDDWGFDGALSRYGLPNYATAYRYNNLELSDPLYGQIPVAWLNIRYNRLTIDSSDQVIELHPIFADSGKNYSRFDYYRGDYNFKDFSLIVSGQVTEKVRWRFWGENFVYGGNYGYFFASLSPVSLSLFQIYQIDLSTHLPEWEISSGITYQKFMPGQLAASAYASIGDLHYLRWNRSGSMKEFRTNLYTKAIKKSPNRRTLLQGQVSTFQYHNNHNNILYRFGAEGHHYSATVEKEYRKATHIWRYFLHPSSEAVFFHHGSKLRQSVVTQFLEYANHRSPLGLTLRLGLVNTNVYGILNGQYRFGKSWRIRLNIESNYQYYPLSFQTDIGGISSNSPSDKGFDYQLGSLELSYASAALNLQSALIYQSASCLYPHKNALEDTGFTYKRYNISTPYFRQEVNINLPWRTALIARLLISPGSGPEADWQLQTYLRLRQELDLFKGNLQLYACGDLIYQFTPDRPFWFDQLRTTGFVETTYFTNDQITFNGRAGAHIGPFHIYYVIYNAEERAYSPLSGIPYRCRLKVFGVEWSFIN